MTEPGNQTQFTFEEPLFEAPPSVPTSTEVSQKPWYRQPKILIILGGAAVILLFLIAAMTSRRVPTQEELILQASPSPTSTTISPLQVRINQLKTELQAADPTKQDLPFPPVNMQLELASPKP